MTNLKSDYISARTSIIKDLQRHHHPIPALVMAIILGDIFYCSSNYKSTYYQSLVTRSCLPPDIYNRFLRLLVWDGYVDLDRNLVFAKDSDGLKYTELNLHLPKDIIDYVNMTDEELDAYDAVCDSEEEATHITDETVRRYKNEKN